MVAAVLPLGGGCGGDVVAVEFNFPSQDTFVRSDSAELYGVAIEPAGAGLCPRFAMDAELDGGSLDADFESGQQPICSLRDGRFDFPAPPGGLHAFVAVVRNSMGVAFLTGCTVEEVHSGTDRLLIVLATTDEYRRAVPMLPPTGGCTADDYCRGACP
jgi:hypothetical protein